MVHDEVGEVATDPSLLALVGVLGKKDVTSKVLGEKGWRGGRCICLPQSSGCTHLFVLDFNSISLSLAQMHACVCTLARPKISAKTP